MPHGSPITPISIFPTTNSPRPHRQSQDQNTTRDHFCNNKINNTNPSLGSIPSLTLTQARHAPRHTRTLTAQPRLAPIRCDDNAIADTDTDTHTHTHTHIHTHLDFRLRQPASTSTSASAITACTCTRLDPHFPILLGTDCTGSPGCP
ncbi:hypothetical protein LA080_006139 [Diaporthe eres]|nr:hypothetical protein LA080_006139 [Diaporthe eres]